MHVRLHPAGAIASPHEDMQGCPRGGRCVPSSKPCEAPSLAKTVDPLHGSDGLPENGFRATVRLVTDPEDPLYAKSGSTL
jgi:hypothetical protein